jgi:hypothetical protein
MPQPMTPMVMRSCAGTRRARAKGAAENAAAAAADCMNLRRVIAEVAADEDVDIGAPEMGWVNAARMITPQAIEELQWEFLQFVWGCIPRLWNEVSCFQELVQQVRCKDFL